MYEPHAYIPYMYTPYLLIYHLLDATIGYFGTCGSLVSLLGFQCSRLCSRYLFHFV